MMLASAVLSTHLMFSLRASQSSSLKVVVILVPVVLVPSYCVFFKQLVDTPYKHI